MNYKNYIQENDLIVKIGSYDGLAYENYGFREMVINQKHECHLIEPQPSVFERLKVNYKDSVNEINFYNLAIYDSNGECDFHICSTNPVESSFVRHTNFDTIKVKTQTIDSFLEENNIFEIGGLFLDIEGTEDIVISQLFEKTNILPKLIRYEYPHLANNDALEKYIKSKGYIVGNCIYSPDDKVCVRSDVF